MGRDRIPAPGGPTGIEIFDEENPTKECSRCMVQFHGWRYSQLWKLSLIWYDDLFDSSIWKKATSLRHIGCTWVVSDQWWCSVLKNENYGWFHLLPPGNRSKQYFQMTDYFLLSFVDQKDQVKIKYTANVRSLVGFPKKFWGPDLEFHLQKMMLFHIGSVRVTFTYHQLSFII